MAKSRLVFAVLAVALILLWLYATRTGMDNRGFVVAGYGLTWAVLLGYTFRLRRRCELTYRALAAFGAVKGPEKSPGDPGTS
jgi:hypothetical protein